MTRRNSKRPDGPLVAERDAAYRRAVRLRHSFTGRFAAPSDDIGLGRPWHELTDEQRAACGAVHDDGPAYDSGDETDLPGRSRPGAHVASGSHQPFAGRRLQARRVRFAGLTDKPNEQETQ